MDEVFVIAKLIQVEASGITLALAVIATIGDKIVETLPSNGVTLKNKTIQTHLPLLHSKLGCLLFFVAYCLEAKSHINPLSQIYKPFPQLTALNSNFKIFGIIENSQEFPKIPTAVFTHSQVFPEIPRFFIFAHLHVLE